MDILIVDDDKSTLLMLSMLLAKTGWRIEGRLDADTALTTLKKRRFDWLLVDGQIQPIDGFELSERARKLRPDLGIVMISGIYEASDIGDRPIRRLFRKPVDADELIAYLSRSS